MTEISGRDILAGWRADQEAAAIYKNALLDAQKRVAAADARITELSKHVKTQARRWPFGLGLFAGVDQHGGGVVGAGLVVLLK